jgi:hypothetical protein
LDIVMNYRLAVSVLSSAVAACLATAAQAATPSVAQSIDRHAAAQARTAADVAHGRISPSTVAAIETQAAAADRSVADQLIAHDDANAQARVAAAERDFARTVRQNERTHQHGHALERTHERVAVARDAEQQHQIAHGLRSGRLNTVQTSELKRAQAAIVDEQASLARRGGESVDDALHMQHLQDVQDWAIHVGHEPGDVRA